MYAHFAQCTHPPRKPVIAGLHPGTESLAGRMIQLVFSSEQSQHSPTINSQSSYIGLFF